MEYGLVSILNFKGNSMMRFVSYSRDEMNIVESGISEILRILEMQSIFMMSQIICNRNYFIRDYYILYNHIVNIIKR